MIQVSRLSSQIRTLRIALGPKARVRRGKTCLNSSMKIGIFFLVFVLFLPLLGSTEEAQTQPTPDYYQQALKAFEQKDYITYAANLEMLVQSGVNHPLVLYSLAGAYALTDNPKESAKWLNQLAELGLSFAIEEDEDFDAIKDTDEFKAAVLRFQKNMTPTDNSVPGFTIPEKDFMAEGITYDPVEDLFYAGSILKHKIISIDRKGIVKEFSSPDDGLWCVLGMSVDAKRRTLWVATAAISELPGFGVNRGRSGIFQYSLKTGKLVQKYLIADTTQSHVLGDVIVDSKGNVFTTDSNTPAIYRIQSGGKNLEVLLGPELFRSPQGLCLSKDEKTLFVADYSRGIFVIDIATKASKKIVPLADSVINGLDGFYMYENTFIATQNGITPNRVLRLYPNSDFSKIQSVKILESNNKVFGEPTLGVIVKGWFYYMANSQLGQYLDDDEIELIPSQILKLQLSSK